MFINKWKQADTIELNTIGNNCFKCDWILLWRTVQFLYITGLPTKRCLLHLDDRAAANGNILLELFSIGHPQAFWCVLYGSRTETETTLDPTAANKPLWGNWVSLFLQRNWALIFCVHLIIKEHRPDCFYFIQSIQHMHSSNLFKSCLSAHLVYHSPQKKVLS